MVVDHFSLCALCFSADLEAAQEATLLTIGGGDPEGIIIEIASVVNPGFTR